MASGWKRAAEILLARGGAVAIAGRFRRPYSIVLAYHNIVPHGERAVGDLSLHTDQGAFGAQLDFLQSQTEIVELSRVFERRDVDARTPRVAITFDDAYRGTMTAGLAELAARELPATVFVPPGLLGSEGFWWDSLASPGGGLDPRVRRRALQDFAGIGTDVMFWAAKEGITQHALPNHAQPVTERELLSATHQVGLTLGAHTWSHPNLTRISAARCDHELGTAKEWLASKTAHYVDWVAYPYGLWNDYAVQSAERLFEGALLVDGGLAESRGLRRQPTHQTPRLNIPRGLSLEGLALRLVALVT